MGHSHALHVEVEAECECCGLGCWFTFRDRSDSVVCGGCQRHYGSELKKLQLRDQDHKSVWISELRVRDEKIREELVAASGRYEALEAETGKVRAENDQLRSALATGFSNAMPADVERILQDDEVQTSLEQRNAAYRSRDHAYRSIWKLDQLHHASTRAPEDCSCGRRATSCREYQALEVVREALNQWEKAQIERAQHGRQNGLPREHPDYR